VNDLIADIQTNIADRSLSVQYCSAAVEGRHNKGDERAFRRGPLVTGQKKIEVGFVASSCYSRHSTPVVFLNLL
jgi:hypothetical protein